MTTKTEDQTVTEENIAPDGSVIESPLAHLSEEEIEAIGREFDAIHDEVFNDLGERDARYIKSMIEMHRRLVLMGRAILVPSRFWPAWILGTSALGSAKILENMEIGHNVMHGQWDWMNNPEIHSSTWDWDTASTKEAWKHSHNYVHHTFTNIRGKDKDLGYEIMRIDPHQKWNPVYLLQPFYNVLLMILFEWGVAVHDLDFEAIRTGEKSKEQVGRELKGIAGKAWTQIRKDYIAFPALSGLIMGGFAAAAEGVRQARGPSRRESARRRGRRLAARAAKRAPKRLRGRVPVRARARMRAAAMPGSPVASAFAAEFKRSYRSTLWADVTANIIRNVWSNAIIFCGHFPDQTYTFSQEEVENESKGGWYVRQLVGAANIEGSPFFHVASGNLGYQVEHHLFPDMPSTRYGEIAPKVKDVCKRYGLPYNTGPLSKQWGTVQRTILRLAFPGGKPRPKPGPYQGSDIEAAPARRNGGAAALDGAGGNGGSPTTKGADGAGHSEPAATENVPAERTDQAEGGD